MPFISYHFSRYYIKYYEFANMLCLDAKTDWQTLKSEQTQCIVFITFWFSLSALTKVGWGRQNFHCFELKISRLDIEQFGFCTFQQKKFYLAIYILVNMWSSRTGQLFLGDLGSLLSGCHKWS